MRRIEGLDWGKVKGQCEGLFGLSSSLVVLFNAYNAVFFSTLSAFVPQNGI